MSCAAGTSVTSAKPGACADRAGRAGPAVRRRRRAPDRPEPAGRLDEPAGGVDLGAHRAGGEGPGPQLGRRGPPDRALAGAAVPQSLEHGLDVGEQQQGVGLEGLGQERRR